MTESFPGAFRPVSGDRFVGCSAAEMPTDGRPFFAALQVCQTDGVCAEVVPMFGLFQVCRETGDLLWYRAGLTAREAIGDTLTFFAIRPCSWAWLYPTWVARLSA